MEREGITTLEEWFRWAEEWAMLLRVYGRLRRDATVLEIGCGLGRIAFPLRFALARSGRYIGFDITAWKIEFLQRTFTAAYPNFAFTLADILNTHYNPGGTIAADAYRFPVADRAVDLVYAASVFTHMAPRNLAHYLRESARVLAPGGRCVFSFFLLDRYDPARPRPLGFGRPDFAFDHTDPAYGDRFAMAFPDDPERMTAYRLPYVESLAADAGLELAGEPAPGVWSGADPRPVSAQDIVVLRRRGE
jgi:SAM-dependent methyltransferase